jgi:hypothetical protein
MIKYSDFLKQAKKKKLVVTSRYNSFKNFLVKSFETWECGDEVYIIQVLMNDDVIIYKQTDNI